MMSKEKTSQPILFVGIDWADVDHVACWIDSISRLNDSVANCLAGENDEQRSHQIRGHENQQQAIEIFTQEPEEIAEWVGSLKKKFPNHRILMALEQSRGALIAGLANYPELIHD